MKNTLFKKTFITIGLVACMLTLSCATVFAHGEDSTDQQQQQQTTTMATADDFNFTVDTDNCIATLLYADGTPLANASVTVKNGTTGQDGDIAMNESANANGEFDYSTWVSQGVKVLRVTTTNGSGTVEFNIETGAMTIEAGKSNSGGSGDRGGNTSVATSTTNTYILIGVAVAVIAVVAVVVITMQKKKKAAFAANAKGKGKPKK